MRLIFCANQYLNSVITDEAGRQLYTISTYPPLQPRTTITKYGPNGGYMIGVITWRTLGDTTIWFGATGVEVAANTLLGSSQFPPKRTWTGPDGGAYSWSRSINCTLKAEGTDFQLAKYHKRNYGIWSAAHGPYLEVSPSVFHMLDYIVIIFLYVERQNEIEKRVMRATAHVAAHALCTVQ
ncbi:hypothetical protein EDC04DRAFT_2700290 [Pisolithus marmoratus]|nr:hypothetical protein EDC04DRAFT_2700290 [Pisolithus marmoratus]